MQHCDCGFVLVPTDDIAALSTDSMGKDNEGVNTENTYKTTAVPASPLEHGPSKTNTRVLNSGKNKNKNIVEKHVSSSSLEPPSTKIPRHVLMRTYLFQKEIHLDVGVENLAQGIVHLISALLNSGANRIFIDQVWAEQIGLPLVKLDVSIPVYYVDGTLNTGGCITHKCSFHQEKPFCYIAGLIVTMSAIPE
ncbi:hypothetical protein SERLADRAFT_438309 [Serpula lacrymans var. lacrymans S7.9]|uniref:Uncharacterized protein n=1 Tax=Serpula lacrymans var. lacrymans (strain S7.9) TaxID=578457 RepID=F8NXL9_SERL9|nr:uncharacterized protein SERLADRAFT_438309 [Serpula lacrymans var. lacrymans S7.9]EGO24691.1 hypothetical protein SERLADRAFT_438309 [Serpula lacrymans var. lacrymans S7.9]